MYERGTETDWFPKLGQMNDDGQRFPDRRGQPTFAGKMKEQTYDRITGQHYLEDSMPACALTRKCGEGVGPTCGWTSSFARSMKKEQRGGNHEAHGRNMFSRWTDFLTTTARSQIAIETWSL